MTDAPPVAPETVPDDVIEMLGDWTPAQLRGLAEYADALADSREVVETKPADENDESETNQIDEPQDDRPDDVPAKATITVKEINENRYYYWQWRDGDAIRSKYKGPVSAEE
ncbi:hypothetical protein VB773_21310 [Haloarculaceae archaeon H-GB2-1]|nr:hypothetical protein [Haloarculaceae archaeon H-GB1-1]MEA5409857.1 hypothetical protein [Haloarculaceae archaeon H-GB2-1]